MGGVIAGEVHSHVIPTIVNKFCWLTLMTQSNQIQTITLTSHLPYMIQTVLHFTTKPCRLSKHQVLFRTVPKDFGSWLWVWEARRFWWSPEDGTASSLDSLDANPDGSTSPSELLQRIRQQRGAGHPGNQNSYYPDINTYRIVTYFIFMNITICR